MFAAEGLQPTSKGARVRFSESQRTVIDGPFAESKELIAGFWLWQVRSMNEAIEWLKRAPFDGGTEVEIRPVFEADDLGAGYTPELRAQDERLRGSAETKNIMIGQGTYRSGCSSFDVEWVRHKQLTCSEVRL
jgi:hypothetical protein